MGDLPSWWASDKPWRIYPGNLPKILDGKNMGEFMEFISANSNYRIERLLDKVGGRM